MVSYAVLFLVCLFLSYIAVRVIRKWAESEGLLDVPNERSSHLRPVARGGGIAIVLITLLGLVLFGKFDRAFGGVIFGAVLIAGLSWWDDVRSLSSGARLIGHSIAALLAIQALGWWDRIELPWAGTIELEWLGAPLTFLWIVGLTNAYNFMDGIDGIAGGQALMAGIGWAVLASIGGLPLGLLLALLICSSSIGFLAQNWPPARIFMGDVGSAFLGYLFAILPTFGGRQEASLPFCGFLLVWPFVFDTCFTFLRRLRRGERVFTAHRSHLYQRLVISGLSHRTVTLIYMALAAIGALAAVGFFLGEAETLAGLAGPASAMALWLGVTYRERSSALTHSRGSV